MKFFVSEKIIFMPEQIFKVKTLQVFVFGYTPGQVYINGIMMIFWTSLFWLDLATILGVYRKSGFMLCLSILGYLFGFVFYLGLLVAFGVDPDGEWWMKLTFAVIGLYHLVGVFIAFIGLEVITPVTEIKNQANLEAEQKITTNNDIV